MKTFLFFIVTCLVSTGALLAALHARDPFPNFAIAFSIWIPFIWVQSKRSRKQNQRQQMEQEFRNHMRSKFDR